MKELTPSRTSTSLRTSFSSTWMMTTLNKKRKSSKTTKLTSTSTSSSNSIRSKTKKTKPPLSKTMTISIKKMTKLMQS